MKKLKSLYLRITWHLKINKFWYGSITASIIASLIVMAFFDSKIDSHKQIVAIATIQVVILTFLLINLNRIINRKISALTGLLRNAFGLMVYENQFAERKSHFPIEKLKICREFVYEIFPDLIKSIKKDNPDAARINIILGSGTSIAPIFDYLIKKNYPLSREDIYIYTNNLEGIDYVQRHSKEFEFKDMNEENFILISGFPSNRYRAIQGPNALNFFESFNRGFDTGKEIKVGVLTSNWILIGTYYDKLQLCARGDYHYQFKKKIIESCDYIVVVAPLGKILRLDNHSKLNDALPNSETKYKTIQPPEGKVVFLQTSFRPITMNSPLLRHSQELRLQKINSFKKNYSFFNHTTWYKPRGSQSDIMILECPHDYIRDKFSNFYLE